VVTVRRLGRSTTIPSGESLAIADLPAPARAKTYMGYSDAGFLLAGMHKAGLNVAWGPMPQDVLRDDGQAAVQRALDWLVRRDPSALEPALERPAMAFNLTVLSNLLARTPYGRAMTSGNRLSYPMTPSGTRYPGAALAAHAWSPGGGAERQRSGRRPLIVAVAIIGGAAQAMPSACHRAPRPPEVDHLAQACSPPSGWTNSGNACLRASVSSRISRKRLSLRG